MNLTNKTVFSQVKNEEEDFLLTGDIIITWPYITRFDGAFIRISSETQCGSFYYEEDDCPRFKEFYGVSEENLPKVTSLLNTTIENIKDLILNEYI